MDADLKTKKEFELISLGCLSICVYLRNLWIKLFFRTKPLTATLTSGIPPRSLGDHVGSRGNAMTREVWAGLAMCVLCAVEVGCGGAHYYTAPPEQIPPPVNVGRTAVQIIDQRPEWEKKPFTGVVCLYHMGKAHPDAWAQLAEETNAVVAAMPQKPERVEVMVTSFRLVKSGDTAPRYHDYSAGPNPNPSARTQDMLRTNRESHQQRVAEANGTSPNAPAPNATTPSASAPTGQAPPLTDERPGNTVELMFASKDDPRRKLRVHPLGASCSIQATVRVIYPGGQERTVNVETIVRGTNTTGTGYQGEALDDAAKNALFQYGRQFRSGVGLNPDL
jgi:hypothetical protein